MNALQSKSMYISHNNPVDPVQLFCIQNKIEYSWDWNGKNGVWNEILIDGKLLMQITQGITVEQFKIAIIHLSKNFYTAHIPDEGIDYTICLPQNEETEEMFNRFFEKHKHAFI